MRSRAATRRTTRRFEAYLALLDRLGCDRGVLVQPSAYGRDNRAMLDALARSRKRLRGVAVGGSGTDCTQR